MINYLDVLFFTAISVVGVAGFSIATALIIDIGAKEKTHHKIEKNDTYIVYKWFGGRIKSHKAYKFKKDKNKIIFLKDKITVFDLMPYIIVLGIFFMISAIKAGLLVGIGVLLYAILLSVEYAFISYKHNVLYCRRFLSKKLKL